MLTTEIITKVIDSINFSILLQYDGRENMAPQLELEYHTFQSTIRIFDHYIWDSEEDNHLETEDDLYQYLLEEIIAYMQPFKNVRKDLKQELFKFRADKKIKDSEDEEEEE